MVYYNLKKWRENMSIIKYVKKESKTSLWNNNLHKAL